MKNGGRIALFEYTLADDRRFSKSEMKILNKVTKASAMDGLRDFKHDMFQNVLSNVGFNNIKVKNISKNTMPSLARLRKFLIVPYFLIRKTFWFTRKVSKCVSSY